MSPNPDLLRAEFLGITVRHEEHETPRAMLAALFAEASGRYDLERMEFTESGATLSGGDGAELVLRTGQTAAACVTHLGFREGAERVRGMLSEGLARLPSDELLWVEDITLVALWDCEHEGGAADHLSNDMLGLSEERRELLGGEDATHGMRIWRSLGRGSVDVSIEPMHADLSKIYLRLVFTEDDVVDDVDAVMERAELINEYLYGPVAQFVGAPAHRQ